MKLELLGLPHGKATPARFYSKVTMVGALAHGDDFVVVGPEEGVEEVKGKIREWYDVKLRAILRREAGYNQDTVVLGMVIR